MREDLRLVREIAKALDAKPIPYFITGSVAAMHYGEPRYTQDVDVVAEIAGADVRHLLDSFREPDFYLERDAILWALEHDGMFNIVDLRSPMKIDVAIAKDTRHNASRFHRRRRVEIEPGFSAAFAAPEDVILKKLEFYRDGASDKHLRDIASMIKVSGDTFDRAYLDAWAIELNVNELWHEVKTRLAW